MWVMLNLEQDISIVLNVCLIFLFKNEEIRKKQAKRVMLSYQQATPFGDKRQTVRIIPSP